MKSRSAGPSLVKNLCCNHKPHDKSRAQGLGAQDEWGLDPAGWDNALVYQNTFTSYLSTGQKTAEWKTVSLNLNQIIQKAKDAYPELAGMECKWINGSGSLQSGIGSVKDCSLDAQNGTLRYKFLRMTKIMKQLIIFMCTDSRVKAAR